MKKIHSVFKGINHSVSLPCVILQQHFSSHQSWLSTNSMLKQSSDLFRFLLQCRPCSVCVTRWCTAVMFGLWSLDLCSSVKRISCSDLVSSTVHVGKNALWLCDGARTILIRGQKLLIWTLNYWGDIVCPPDSLREQQNQTTIETSLLNDLTIKFNHKLWLQQHPAALQ